MSRKENLLKELNELKNQKHAHLATMTIGSYPGFTQFFKKAVFK